MEYVFHYLHLWLGLAAQSYSQTHKGASMALGFSPWVIDAVFIFLAWRGMKSLWAPKPIAPKPPTPKTFTAPDGTLMVQKTDDEGTPLPGQWVPKKYRPDQEAVAQEPAPKKQNPKIVVGGREWVR